MSDKNRDVFNVDNDKNDVEWKSQSLKNKKNSTRSFLFIVKIILIISLFAMAPNIANYITESTLKAQEEQSFLPIRENSEFHKNNEINKNKETETIDNSEKDSILDYEPIIDVTPETTEKENIIYDDFYFEQSYCEPENNYYCFVKDGIIKESNISYNFFDEWTKANLPWINEPNRGWMTGSPDYLLTDIKYSEEKDLNISYFHTSAHINDLYVTNINSTNNTITLTSKDSYEGEPLDQLILDLEILPITSAYNEVREGDTVFASVEIEKINKSTNTIEGYLVQIEKQN